MAGGRAWQGWGACMAGCVYGMGHAWQGGVRGKGGCAWQGGCMAGETATAADGMHTTGIHSCFIVY